MKRVYFLVLAGLFTAMAQAQETHNVNVNLKAGNSGAAGVPWLWIVGGLVFIVLLVALLSGRRSSRVVQKRTIIRE